MMAAFNALQQQTQIYLEHPFLTNFHQQLVTEGNFDVAEKLLMDAAQQELFDEYIAGAVYTPRWKRIHSTDANGELPGMRGGHQMCMDVEAGLIYLFGGWNGSKDLSDFWVYNVQQERWSCLSQDTRKQGGPGPRSCHKIVFDPNSKHIYVLGRYIDPQTRPGSQCESDFYRYDTVHQRWTKLSDNTAVKLLRCWFDD